MRDLECDWIQVDGESMRPLLRTGEWVGVEWRADSRAPSLRRGDIVLGRGPGEIWIVHRLVSSSVDPDGRETIVLKGDASSMTEELSPDQVWAKVVAVRRGAEAAPAPLRTGAMDRLIAAFSRMRLRRAVFALGWLRRRFS